MAKIITIKHEDGSQEEVIAEQFILMYGHPLQAISGIAVCSQRFIDTCESSDVFGTLATIKKSEGLMN
jgi:hypothetical protein